jgi:GTPase SAR1 family protein
MPYGQIVLGPPGSGKTTYCRGYLQYSSLLSRPSYIINLDPGASNAETIYSLDDNDLLVYDVCSACCGVASVMADMKLGPNGGLVFCMDYILEHIEVIIGEVISNTVAKHNEKHDGKCTWNDIAETVYLVIDMPGQVELYTHSTVTSSIIAALTKPLHKGGLLACNLCAVNVVDALSCLSPTTYVSTILVSLQSMINVQLPAINVMSKMDLLKPHIENNALDCPLDFYLECADLDHLVQFMPKGKRGRRRSLAASILDLVQDFSLLRYRPLDVSDGVSLGVIVQDIDDANGYVFQGDRNRDVEQMVRSVKEKEGRDVIEQFMMGGFKEVVEDLNPYASMRYNNDDNNDNTDNVMEDSSVMSTSDMNNADTNGMSNK